MSKLKPAFPVFYLAVFAYTVWIMFTSYVLGSTPPVVEGVIGEPNKSWMLGIMNAYAFMLCVYVVIYYARLEMLEHTQVNAIPNNKLFRFIEFVVRFLLVGVVALKVLSYHALDDLFLFSLVLCTLLSVWLFLMKVFHIVAVSTSSELAPNIVIFVLSVWAHYISAPEVQSQYAVPLLVASLVAAIILLSSITVLSIRLGREFFDIARNFVLNW